MDSPGGQGKHIVTEEQFRNFYPDVSIQPSKKATLDLEKRLASKNSPTKAAVVMTKTPVAVKSQATPKSSRTTNTVAGKANSPMVAKSPAPVTQKTPSVTKTIVPLKTPVASKVGAVCNSPAATTGRSMAITKTPVNKPAVVVKTPATTVKTPVSLASPVAKTTAAALRASSVKLQPPPPAPKLVPTTPTLSKTPQSIAKPQQTSSLMKIQPKPAVTAVSNKDSPDQSTITVLNFSVPSHPSAQRSSNQ